MLGFTPNIPLMISVGAFFAVFLFFVGLAQHFRHQAKKKAIVDKIRQADHQGLWTQQSTSIEETSGLRKYFLYLFHSMGKRVVPKGTGDYSKTKIKFLRAGIRNDNAASIFLGTKAFLMVFFALAFLTTRISLFKLLSIHVTLIIFIFSTFLGFYLPDIWLRIKTVRRKREIFEGLPDALDLLVVCVEAGMGLDAAIARVAQEMKLSSSVLSDELKLLNLEIRAGKTRQDALRNFALRTDMEDVKSLTTLLVQTDRFGTSVAQALRIYSDTFRSKRFLKAEEIAAKLPVKLVFPLILLIFPALFVVIAGPAVIRIYQALFLNQ